MNFDSQKHRRMDIISLLCVHLIYFVQWTHKQWKLMEDVRTCGKFHSISGAKAPSGPWPPSQDASRHSALSSGRLLHLRIPRICDVSLQTTSSHLILGFPTSFVLRNFPLRTLFGISGPVLKCSDILCTKSQILFLIARSPSVDQSSPRHL